MIQAPINDLHQSNGLTYLALAAGICAVTMAFDPHRAPVAAAALAVAAIADTFDGRFARLFRRTERESRIGKEIDSLVDAIAFGAAPVVVLFAGAGPMSGWPAVFWAAAAVFYALSAVTRLAHFNLDGDHSRFVGVPTPAAALLCATTMLLPSSVWLSTTALVAAGVGMIAPIPLPRPRGAGLLLFAGWAAVVLGLHVRRMGG